MATMRTRVGRNLDRTVAAGNEVDVNTCDEWLNDGLKRLYYKLADCGEQWFRKTQSITLVSGTAGYTLATDFYKVKGVDVVIGSDTYRVPRYMSQERNRKQLLNGSVIAGWADYEYMIHGTTIQIIPTPGSGTLKVHYVPQFARIATGGDLSTSGFPEGWEDYAVLEATVRGREKLEEDATYWIGERDRVWADIVQSATPRDQDEPKRYVDVTGRLRRMRRYR